MLEEARDNALEAHMARSGGWVLARNHLGTESSHGSTAGRKLRPSALCPAEGPASCRPLRNLKTSLSLIKHCEETTLLVGTLTATLLRTQPTRIQISDPRKP